MIAPTILDIVDLREQLEYPNLLQKSKGFLEIAKRILEQQLDPKTDKEYRKVLFDCFYKYGDVPLESLLETLPTILQKKFPEIMKREEVLAEFTLRIDKIDKIQRAFPAVLYACIPSFSNFLSAASKINPETLTTMFVGEELQTEHYRYILVLIFSGLLNDEQKRRLGNLLKIGELRELFLKHHPHLYRTEERSRYDPEKFLRECPAGELETHPLDNMDFIQRLHLLHERPATLRNPNIGRHILYMPYMFLMLQHVPLHMNVIQNPKYVQQNNEIKKQFGECQRQIDFAAPDFYQCTLTLETFIGHIITRNLISEFVSLLEYCPDSVRMFHKPYLLPAITALIPHVHPENHELRKRIAKWTATVLNETSGHADSFMLFFIGAFSVPYFPLDQKLIMDIVAQLATAKHSIISATKFFGLLASRSSHIVKAYECLAKFAAQYPSTIDISSQKIRFSQEDSEEVFRANMLLAKECCLATDDNDRFIAQISECLKDNGFRLAAAVDALYDLVKNDVLELVDVRKMLQKKLKTFGNDDAFASYCHVLSLGAAQQDEESEEDFQSRKLTYIKELYDYTKLENVASAAWKALGDYKMEDIEAALSLAPASFGVEFLKIQLDGYLEFLKKQLDAEKESYQRPLYNTLAQNADLPPFLVKIDGYKDNLGTKNKEEAWFWSATLPLGASILQLAAPSNKAQTAVRLLKGCLLNVPTADSHEGMLRLMAGWRICTREALNALCESKSNDLLWARDQICNEGRLSLTQKSESVDSIMMMLTVLVDIMEEKLRLMDDSKQIDEIVKAQKPWAISVFEFVATRLPKEMKEKREQRVNPIYQVMTQSNKSSLHTAIFCVRLLRRHPAILEFYRDQRDLGIARDPMFEALLGEEEKSQLVEELIPNQNLLWITAEAYGADSLTAEAFHTQYLPIIEQKSPITAEPILSVEHIPEFFSQLTMLTKSEIAEIQVTLKKALEKFWNNGTEETKKEIYEGLAELALISGSNRKQTVIQIEKVSDRTVLKGMLQCFDEKLSVEPNVLRLLLKAFPDHQRSDGRYLPPVDWLKILNRAQWKEEESQEGRLAILKLACEQNIPDVVFRFSGDLSKEELLVIVDHFKQVIKMLPRKQFIQVLKQLTELARVEEESTSSRISKAISEFEKDPIIHVFLTQDLPKLVNTIGVVDPILNALKEPMEFAGVISRCFDLWLEARNGEKMNIKRIYELIVEENDEMRINAMFSLVSFEARRLNTRQKINKLLDVITVSRIARSSNGDLSLIFALFLSIIVSLNSDVDIPLCWFGNESDVVKILNAARKPFFKALLDSEGMRKEARHIGSFLRPYVDGDESEFYDSWQKDAAKDMLCTLLATFGPDALETLMQEGDFFWQSILPVE